MRINSGYEILYAHKLDEETEVVLGVCHSSKMYVTWKCSNSNNYYWGHYFEDEIKALEDLICRIKEEVNHV